jgi:hypothetical protein
MFQVKGLKPRKKELNGLKQKHPAMKRNRKVK